MAVRSGCPLWQLALEPTKDGTYGGQCALAIKKTHGISVEVVHHTGNRSAGTWQDTLEPLRPEEVAKGFVVQAKHWAVDGTHAWHERCRRLLAHHDRVDWAPLSFMMRGTAPDHGTVPH